MPGDNPDLVFLTVDYVVEVHQQMIALFGGDNGLLSKTLLLSAVETPRATFGGAFLHKDVFEMAAAYAFHLIKNHPFVDGNKRTGVTIAIAFLIRNGISVKLTQRELVNLGLSIANDKKLSKQQIAAAIFRSKASLDK